jgi:hypothetical protein
MSKDVIRTASLNHISLKDYINLYGFDKLDKLNVVPLNEDYILLNILLKGIGIKSLSQIYLLSGLIIKTDEAIYILKSLENITSVNDLLSRDWEIISDGKFNSGFNNEGGSNIVDESFYKAKYFIVYLSKYIYMTVPCSSNPVPFKNRTVLYNGFDE